MDTAAQETGGGVSGLKALVLGLGIAALGVGSLIAGLGLGAAVWGVSGLRQQMRTTFDSDPPRVTLTSPVEGTRTPERETLVRGRIEDATAVSAVVNGEKIKLRRVGQHWEFAHKTRLSPGKSDIELEVLDAQSHATTVKRTVDRIPLKLVELWPQERAVKETGAAEIRGRVQPAHRGEVRVGGIVRPILADGTFRFHLRGLDDGPNRIQLEVHPERCQPISRELEIVVDRKSPTLVVSSPAEDGKTYRRTLEIRGEVQDENLDQLTVNGKQAATEAGPFTAKVDLPTFGVHEVTIVARDKANRETVVKRSVRRVRPRIELSLTLPRQGTWVNTSSIRVSGRVGGDVPINEVQLKVDGAETPVRSNGEFSTRVNAREGRKVIQIVAKGGGVEAKLSRTVHYDRSSPRVSVHYPSNYASVSATSVTIRGTVYDSSPWVNVRVGWRSTRVTPGRTFYLSVPLKPGSNRLMITSTDAAGNRGTPMYLTVTRKGGSGVVRPSGSRVTLAALPVGQGARYGNWVVWKAKYNTILWLHGKDRLAVEYVTDSNGWYRYATRSGSSYVVLGYSAAPRPQNISTPNYRSYFTKYARYTLSPSSGTLQNNTYRGSATSFKIENTKYKDNLVFFPYRSTYQYGKAGRTSRNFGASGEIKGRVPPAVGGPKLELHALPIGDGLRFGSWHFWRVKKNRLLVTYPSQRLAIELILDSNGWFRYVDKFGGSYVVYTFGKPVKQSFGVSNYRTYFSRTPTKTLKSNWMTKTFQNYKVSASATSLRLSNSRFNDQLTFYPNSSTYYFGKPGKTTRRLGPTGEGGAGLPKPPNPNIPKPVAGAQVDLAGIPVGQGAKWGQWAIWKISFKQIILVHARDRLVVELVLSSNGWYRYATRTGGQFTVHGYRSKPVPSRINTTNFRSYYSKTPSYRLKSSFRTVQNWKVSATALGLRLENVKYKDLLIFTSTSSRYRYTANKPGATTRYFGPTGLLQHR